MIRTAIALLLALFVAGFSAAQDKPKQFEPWWVLVLPGDIQSLILSPDGSKLAGLRDQGYGATVILVDVQTLKSRDLIKPRHIRLHWIYTRSASRVSWIADDLLAVDFNDNESESFDLNGKKIADLGEWFIRPFAEKGDKTDWVLAFSDVKKGAIARVDARTGEKSKFKISLPGRLMHWAFDANGALRAATMIDTAFWSDKTKISNWYRSSEQSAWQLLQESPVTEDYMVPLYVSPEPDMLVVSSREGRNTKAIFKYDVRQRKLAELMAAHASEDIVSVSGLDRDTFARVSTAGLKRKTFWFDDRWAKLQATVDASIPGRINSLSGNPNGLVLVLSHSDVDPGRWFLLDTRAMTLKQIAELSEHVKPELMRPMTMLHYPSIDGLQIPAYLTLPAGSNVPAPLVVLIHGGPQARDEWGWDQEVQVLAMNGYAVFQPQFRGSSGFGKAFEEAGYGQWGLAMQDDITAGVQHLVDKKIVDPNRICIVGSSYGGYAALWGVVKTPKLYKCGVSFAGVTDIANMLEDWSDTNSSAVGREFMRARVGSLSDARERFDAVSPLKHAGRIEVPLLILHGERDRRVPISHGKNMVYALKSAGKQVEWVSFPNAGHGLAYLADVKFYLTTLLNFLGRNIGPEAAAEKVAPPTAAPESPR